MEAQIDDLNCAVGYSCVQQWFNVNVICVVSAEIAENLVPIEENEVFTIICIGNDGWTEIRKDCGTTGLVPTDYIQQTS